MTSTSRRQFLQHSLLVSGAVAVLPRSLFAQTAQTTQTASAPAAPADPVAMMRASGATAKITTQALRGHVSVLQGSGGNIAVLPGRDGKLLVDSGFATSRPQLTEALAGISADPIQHLVNTHWHFDHTDGNEWVHSAGATIIAHQKTRERMSTTQSIPAFGATFPPSPAGALPTKTFSATDTLQTNGETLHLVHYDPAHTDTDISVHFANADVLHTGDTWFNGIYPFIDYSTGGSIDGMIAAGKRNLALASAKTIIVPGHGPVGDRAQLQQFYDMLSGVRARVATLKKQGRSVDETIAAKPTAPYDGTFKAGAIPAEVFVRLVYQGV